ncbi:MAG: allophanate hydrolase subunit 1 [Gemmataceae bacterium]|nr:allophanate hydrolase subunit 1 [Gemmataceae bacterium]
MGDDDQVRRAGPAAGRVVPLGDQAVLAYFPDEPAAVRFAAAVRAAAPPWLQDVVPAYATAGVFFDADAVGLRAVMSWVADLAGGGREPPEDPSPGSAAGLFARGAHAPRPPRTFQIPVCYERQLDMARVCEHTGLSADEVIRLHTGTEYTVYAVGFAPGFPYLGYLPPELCGVGRLASPRLRVEPGSVGLTGRQTGIYPLPRPAGWNLIGRTPLVIVDLPAGFFPLRVGDRVRFGRIDEAEFRRLEGERLAVGSGQ